ncbi:MAG: hypothetical protein RBT62_12300 [Spirochaetia bacterium]|jgi:hypothetical protein|nr:hypothetical protein [Spirochaetia bacterium]
MTQSQIVLYTTPDGDIRIDTVLLNERNWLTQEKRLQERQNP